MMNFVCGWFQTNHRVSCVQPDSTFQIGRKQISGRRLIMVNFTHLLISYILILKRGKLKGSHILINYEFIVA